MNTEQLQNDLAFEPIARMSRDIANAAKTLTDEEARFLVDAYYISQDNRIRTTNQVRALGESQEPNSVLAWLAEQDSVLEAQIKRALDKYTQGHPMGAWMRGIHGIGPVIAAGLLAHIDINKAVTAGHIWRFAGLDPTVKWEKGQKRPFNAALKTLCCLPSTVITTKRGFLPISDVVEGDMVLTHKGRWRKVLKNTKEEYNGLLCGLQTFGNSAGTLWVTDNHPIWTTITNRCDVKKGARKSFTHRDKVLKKNCLPDAQIAVMRSERANGKSLKELSAKYGCSESAISQICNNKTRIKPMENETIWMRADGIQSGYKVFYPSAPVEVVTPVIDLSEFADIVDDETVTSAKEKNSLLKHPTAKILPRHISITPDVARVLGLYLAEGHTSKGQITWSFHLDETEYHAAMKGFAEKLGLTYSEQPNIQSNSMQVSTYAKPLAKYFDYHFKKGSHSRTLPEDALCWSAELKIALLKGMFEGDGYLSGRMASYKTVSEQLARGVHLLLNTLGISSTITAYAGNSVGKNQHFIVTVTNNPEFYSLLGFDLPEKGVGETHAKTKVTVTGSWVTARETVVSPHFGYVHNLEVEEDQSYTANGIAVHNCWKLGQSFMKFSGSEKCFYGKLYLERKQYEIERNESGGNKETAARLLTEKKWDKTTEAYKHLSEGKLPPGQIDARARRYAVKIFLSHLQQVWYKQHHGVDAPKPFAIAILGHAHLIQPPNFALHPETEMEDGIITEPNTPETQSSILQRLKDSWKVLLGKKPE